MTSQHQHDISVPEAVKRFGRNQPHTYRITVAGTLAPDWSERLGGLRIEPGTKEASDQPDTVLEGPIRDQAQLLGVLNTLSDLRLPLLGVALIEDQ